MQKKKAARITYGFHEMPGSCAQAGLAAGAAAAAKRVVISLR
jgi:hypothetical protein